ncbi:MAG: cytochrome P450, partial [Alphaproteobacteria bacterium]|nr:cytochrome P450 [Alphaproteobacteria bacterium]
LFPAAPGLSTRRAKEADEVCGHQVPKGAAVTVMPWVIHRHRKLWDDPDRFDPDRFLPERSASRSRYAFIPYSLGPRVCVAAALGSIEILIAMAVLARRVRFRLVPGQRIEPTAWSTLRTKRGIWTTVEPRAGVQ